MGRVRKFAGDSCYLSPCIPEDAEAWYRWLHDPQVALLAGRAAFDPPSLQALRQAVERSYGPSRHMFTILTIDGDRTIGRCDIGDVDHVNRRGWVNILIGEPEFWGKGYGTEALRLLLDFAFTLLDLNTIMLDTIAFNERAIACYKKVGFREMGRWRESRVVNGVAHDLVFMDLLASEFDGTGLRGTVVQTMRDAGCTKR